MASIYLSPSLQEHNIGVNDYGTEEQRMNEIADVIEPILTSAGLTVYRNKPTMTLKEVIEESKSLNVDFHFAIHSNACNGKAKGTTMYVYDKRTEAMRFANLVYEAIADMTPWSDRGIIAKPAFYELNSTKALAGLIEVDFHDNPISEEWIVLHIQQIGQALANAILKYFDIKPVVNWENIIDEKFKRPEEWKARIKELIQYGKENNTIDQFWDVAILKLSK